jgi:hypothetical protein
MTGRCFARTSMSVLLGPLLDCGAPRTEPSWAIAAAFARAGNRTEVRSMLAGESVVRRLGLRRRRGDGRARVDLFRRAVDGPVDAVPADAALASGGVATVRGAPAALAPWRDLAFDRFAHWSGAKRRDGSMSDLVTVSPIFLHRELWQSPLPLGQPRLTLG